MIGETFDPALHEPVGTTVTTDLVAEGTITEVMGVGWKLGDKILRPARVKIAHKND
jgi:molecular chaperone GrpE